MNYSDIADKKRCCVNNILQPNVKILDAVWKKDKPTMGNTGSILI